MIRKVCKVDPMVFLHFGRRMTIVDFLATNAGVDRVIEHLRLTFVVEKLPLSHVFADLGPMSAELSSELEWRLISREGTVCVQLAGLWARKSTFFSELYST